MKPVSAPLTYPSDIVIIASNGEKARIEEARRLAEEARLRAEEEERQRQAEQERLSQIAIANNTNIPSLIVNTFVQSGFSEVDANKMLKVAQYESGLNPNANHIGVHFGLFQIDLATWNGFGCTGYITSAKDNTNCAVKIRKARGFACTTWQVICVYNL